jgi:hypothetical protein
MEKSKISLDFTLSDVLNAPYGGAWKEMCEKYGFNLHCVSDGADASTPVRISLKDAEKWGLINHEEEL